jgi:hypothetical protein
MWIYLELEGFNWGKLFVAALRGHRHGYGIKGTESMGNRFDYNTVEELCGHRSGIQLNTGIMWSVNKLGEENYVDGAIRNSLLEQLLQTHESW